jgi:3-oxoacyl-[acyl-carrier protein] reductase
MAGGPLAGRIALVSGGGRGIGAGIAEALAAAGAAVAINYRSDADAAADTVRRIIGAGGVAECFAGSVAEAEDCAALVAQVTDSLGPIDLLVNNAGIASKGRSVAETDPSELDRVIRTHAYGAHHLSRLVLPRMREVASQPGRRGDIVMISSAATDHMSANGAPYNMAKAALEALARTLAKEEVRHNIHVNTVAPGLVVSEMGRRLARATAGVSDIHELDRSFPFGHVCTPEEIASVVVFVCSGAASYVTGQRIAVDGGGPLR